MIQTFSMETDPDLVHVHPDLRSIAPAFLARARQQIGEMLAALDARDLERVSRVAHQLAGAGTTFGMPFLTDTSRQVERDVKGGDIEAARTKIDVLAAYVSRVRLA